MPVKIRFKGDDSTLSYKEWEVLESDHPLFVAEHSSMQFATWDEGDTFVYDNQIFILKNLRFSPPEDGHQIATFDLEISA